MRAAVLVTLSLFLLLGLSIIVVTLADEPEAGECASSTSFHSLIL